MIWSSNLPQQSARCCWSPAVMQVSIPLSIAGMFICDQLELFAGLLVIVWLSNGTCRMDCASMKSLIHPTFGQTFGSLSTTEQNFVYIVECSTGWNCTLNPSCSSWFLNTVAVFSPGGVLSPTIVISQFDPSHFPLE